MSDVSLSFAPFLPWWAIGALALLAAIVAGLHIYARRSGGILRALGSKYV